MHFRRRRNGEIKMAYFKSNESYPQTEYTEEAEELYDDGFDQLAEETDEYPEMNEEERELRKQSHVRLAYGAGNLFGVIAGAVLILVLLTLIFSMIYFVINDMGRNFSLFQTNF